MWHIQQSTDDGWQTRYQSPSLTEAQSWLDEHDCGEIWRVVWDLTIGVME